MRFGIGMSAGRTFAGSVTLAISCLWLPAQALAEITPSGPGRFTCQADAGRQEQADISAYFGAGAMSAAIQVGVTEAGSRNGSFAGLSFIFADGASASIVVHTDEQDSRRIRVGLIYPGNERILDLGYLRRGRTAQVSLRLDADGILHARGATLDAQRAIGPRQPVRRQLVCGSGTFQIQLVRPAR